jgi:hypothetical protein
MGHSDFIENDHAERYAGYLGGVLIFHVDCIVEE